MSTAKKIIIVILVLLLLLLIGAGCIYYKFWGVTKKQKYERCAAACEEYMTHAENIPECQQECYRIVDYQKPTADTGEPAKNKVKDKANIEIPTIGTKKAGQDEYYCEWSWPQSIITKDSKKVVQPCNSERPYCNYADYTYENVSCCETAVNKEYFNCVTLPEMLEEEPE